MTLNAQQRMARNDLAQARYGFQPSKTPNAQERIAMNDAVQAKMGYQPKPISAITNYQRPLVSTTTQTSTKPTFDNAAALAGLQKQAAANNAQWSQNQPG